MDINTTRRNLLRIGTTAAAYAAGASIVTGGIALASQAKGATLPAVDRTEWDRAFKAMLAANAVSDAAEVQWDCAKEAGTETDALYEEYERHQNAQYDATWALFAMPAPDHAALLWKTEYLFADNHEAGHSTASWSHHVMEWYLADQRRLLGPEAR